MGVTSKLSEFGKKAIAELQMAAGQPEPKSVDHHTDIVRSSSVDKHKPDKKKLERYWELYQKVPIIRQPIRSFASEVVGPGYYVDAENDDLKEDLENWLKHSAIVDGEVDKDFTRLLKKATIQREVKGTALAEKVPDDEGNIYGFKLMKPETTRAFTYPAQSLLLAPDAEVNEDDFFGNRRIFTKQNGDVAAYVQMKKDFRSTRSVEPDKYVAFTRNDIIKLTRDADTGEVFGESRITAVENRLESLLKKLEDNDKAIESLAHPFQLFKFGVGEKENWDPAEIKNFMNEHEQEDFEPGMKQGVQGDVEIDTISGEVAPIDEFLNFDVNWIISEMPLPKYALGGFEEDVNQFVSRSQETRVEKQIQEARKEIESEWTPVLEEKAEEMGYDVDDLNSLVIGEDPEDLNLVEVNQEDENSNTGESGTNFTRPPASTEPERIQEENQEELRQLVQDELEKLNEVN